MSDNGGTWPARAGVAADVVLFSRRRGELVLLAVERGKAPFEGALALPGGFVVPGERAVEAAVRELAEETGVVVRPARLRRFGCYGRAGRDPRGPVTTVTFHGYVAGVPAVAGGDDARAARWIPLDAFLSERTAVAFDHRHIVRDALFTRFG